MENYATPNSIIIVNWDHAKQHYILSLNVLNFLYNGWIGLEHPGRPDENFCTVGFKNHFAAAITVLPNTPIIPNIFHSKGWPLLSQCETINPLPKEIL